MSTTCVNYIFSSKENQQNESVEVEDMVQTNNDGEINDNEKNQNTVLNNNRNQDDHKSNNNNNIGKLEFEQSAYFLNLILMLLEKVFKILPFLVTSQYSNFDITKILDDIFPWPSIVSYSMKDLIKNNENEEIYSKLLIQTLKVLHVATLNESCNWFGIKSDCIKSITNLLVSTNYDTIKKTSFQKLILLSCLEEKIINSPAQLLFDLILIQSELFQGHGNMDVELSSEKNAWIKTIQKGFICQNDNKINSNFILLFDFLLRISFHWNIELCDKVIELDVIIPNSYSVKNKYNTNSFKSGIIPFSPLLFSSLLFLSMNFSLFIENLPKFIQTHLENVSESSSSESSQFFSKYLENAKLDLENFISQVILELLPWNTNHNSYLFTISSCTDLLMKESSFSSFFSLQFVRNITTLFEHHDYNQNQNQQSQKKKSVKNSKKVKQTSWLDELINQQPAELINVNLSEIFNQNNNKFMSPFLLSKILLESNSVFQNLNGELIELFFSNWWALITSIFLLQGKEYLSLSFFTWLSFHLDKVINNQLLDLTENEMIELMIFSIKCINDFSSISESSSQNNWKIIIEEIIEKFLFIILEIIRITQSPISLVSSLQSLPILHHLLNKTPLSTYYHQIITTTALCLCKRIQSLPSSSHSKIINEITIPQFWEDLCQIFERTTNQIQDKDNLNLFCLSWLLQTIVQNSNLKTSLINYSLGCGLKNNNNSNNNDYDGYALTTLSHFKQINNFFLTHMKLHIMNLIIMIV